MKKINPKILTYWIGKIGYQIIDEIISPMCGIDGVIAELYLVDIGIYTMDDKLTAKIATKIVKRYKLDKIYAELIQDWNLAQIVLLILEEGEYGYVEAN